MVTTRFKRHDLIKGAGKGREAYKGGRDGLDDAPGVRAYPGNAALVLFGLVLEALRLLGRLAVHIRAPHSTAEVWILRYVARVAAVEVGLAIFRHAAAVGVEHALG